MAHTTNNGIPTGGARLPPVDYIAGLDLGTLVDHSALALLERTWRPDAQRRLRPHFYVRGLRRWPLLTGYPDIVRDVCSHFQLPPVRGCPLVVDHTGPGVPLVDMLRQANPPCRVVPVCITAGNDVTPGKRGGFNVPKRLLVGALQVLLQTGRLLIAPVKLRDVLARELATFKVKLTAKATETYESAREADHDDLVLCLAPWVPVLTRRGWVPISAVALTDQVLTRQGWKRVLWSGVSAPSASTITVEFNHGAAIECTASHLVYSSARGWVEAAGLMIGEEVAACPSWKHANGVPRVQSLRANAQNVPVHDLTVEDCPEFFAGGILVHNSVAIACWYGQRPASGRPAVHGVQVVEFREPPRSDDGPFGGNLW